MNQFEPNPQHEPVRPSASVPASVSVPDIVALNDHLSPQQQRFAALLQQNGESCYRPRQLSASAAEQELLQLVSPNVDFDFHYRTSTHAKHDSAPLQEALLHGFDELALALIDQGVGLPDLDYPENGSFKKYGDYTSPILSYSTDPRVVTKLLELGADPLDRAYCDHRVYYPVKQVFICCRSFSSEGFAILLDATLEKLSQQNNSGEERADLLAKLLNSVIGAADEESFCQDPANTRKVLSILHERGADASRHLPCEETPIHLAVRKVRVKENVDLLSALVEFNPGLLDARDHYGAAPLHVAAMFLNKLAIECLLAHGADRSAAVAGTEEEFTGKTAYGIAQMFFTQEDELRKQLGDQTVRINPYGGMVVCSPIGPSITREELSLLDPNLEH